jgi:hypothetical protein
VLPKFTKTAWACKNSAQYIKGLGEIFENRELQYDTF